MEGDKKRLLFVITQPVVGGAQKYVFDLAANFQDSGNYDVSVAMGGPVEGDLFKKFSAEKIKTHYLRFLSREVKIFDDILLIFELIKVLKEERPDIIHLNSSKIGLIGAFAAFLYNLGSKHPAKIIFTAHGWIFKEDLSRLARLATIFLARLSAKFQDRIICVSQDDFNQALKHKIAPPRKLYVVHNAVSEIKFLPRNKAREEISKVIGLEIKPDTSAFVNLGRLYSTKGLNYLVGAMDIIKDKFPNKDIVLVIFGDGPEKENLKSQISNLKLEDSIFLTGDISDVSKYLKAFDALALSSTKEGLPYSILEAGLAGVPVVATNVGGIGEIIENEKNGLLVPPKNSEALAQAVLDLITHTEKAASYSVTLKKNVTKRFNFENMIARTEWVYKI